MKSKTGSDLGQGISGLYHQFHSCHFENSSLDYVLAKLFNFGVAVARSHQDVSKILKKKKILCLEIAETYRMVNFVLKRMILDIKLIFES